MSLLQQPALKTRKEGEPGKWAGRGWDTVSMLSDTLQTQAQDGASTYLQEQSWRKPGPHTHPAASHPRRLDPIREGDG
jgi:hypothetical protein